MDIPANEIELAKSRCASSERRAVKREGELERGGLWGVDGDADKDDDGGRGGRGGRVDPGGREDTSGRGSRGCRIVHGGCLLNLFGDKIGRFEVDR